MKAVVDDAVVQRMDIPLITFKINRRWKTKVRNKWSRERQHAMQRP